MKMTIVKSCAAAAVATASLLLQCSVAFAGGGYGVGGGPAMGYAPPGAPCGPEFALVERTICVPTTVMERRTVNVTEFHPEVRQRAVMVNRCVPEVHEVRDVYTVLVPEVRVRTQRYVVQKPVWREVDRDVTVYVPHQEMRQGVRRVCRQVQVEEMHEVTRDQGHWEDTYCEDDHGCSNGCGNGCGRRRWFRSCGGCGDCGDCGYDAGCGKAVAAHIHRSWRPDYVTEQVPVKVWRNQMTEERYEYAVTVCRPEVRTVQVKVCEYVPEERSRDIQYTVCVPQQRERVRNVTTYRVVAEERQQSYTVHVPQIVQKDIEVPVCRMVERKVTCRVPVFYDYGCGGYGCGGCGP